MRSHQILRRYLRSLLLFFLLFSFLCGMVYAKENSQRMQGGKGVKKIRYEDFVQFIDAKREAQKEKDKPTV